MLGFDENGEQTNEIRFQKGKRCCGHCGLAYRIDQTKYAQSLMKTIAAIENWCYKLIRISFSQASYLLHYKTFYNFQSEVLSVNKPQTVLYRRVLSHYFHYSRKQNLAKLKHMRLITLVYPPLLYSKLIIKQGQNFEYIMVQYLSCNISRFSLA